MGLGKLKLQLPASVVGRPSPPIHPKARRSRSRNNTGRRLPSLGQPAALCSSEDQENASVRMDGTAGHQCHQGPSCCLLGPQAVCSPMAASKRGSCDTLATEVNKTRPGSNSSPDLPSLPSMPILASHSRRNTTIVPQLTANLLHPLLGLDTPSFLHPPPRYCIQLHIFNCCTSQPQSWRLFSNLLPQPHLRVRPLKRSQEAFFLIPFELFSNGSKGFQDRALRLRQTGF